MQTVSPQSDATDDAFRRVVFFSRTHQAGLSTPGANPNTDKQ